MTDDSMPDEAVLKDYLLGSLSPAQQEEIDERFLADDALHADLQATADDLIYAYLAGELTPGDRERFESHFLASARRRERVAFIRTLMSAVERERTTGPVARSRWARVVPTLPWAAVLVVSLAAGGWSLVERRRSEHALAAAAQREDALRRQLDAQGAHMRDLESRARTHDAGDVTTWALGSGVERGQGGLDSFTVRGSWIRIRVPLEHDLRVASYRAVLRTREGREILHTGGLREESGPAGRTLDLMVPADLLRPGAYLVSIERDAAGPPEELTATTFAVR